MKLRPTYLIAFSVLFMLACNPSEKKESTEEVKEEPKEEVTLQPEVVGEEIAYQLDTITMKGYIAYDKNKEGKRPGVLVVHEWWGHNDYARKRADMLAELGYVALAVDMYGDGKKAEHPDDAGKFAMSVMSNTDLAQAKFDAALNTLKANQNTDSEQLGAIGYCFGGSVVLSMANAGVDLDAVAAFHSGLTLPIMPEEGKVKAKVLVCNGADDTFIAPEHISAFKGAMDSAKVDYKYIAYEGAVHSFTSPEADANGEKFGLPLAYNEKADKESWEELKMLFNSVFH